MKTPTDIYKIRRIFKLKHQGLSLHEIAIKVNMTAEGVRYCINSMVNMVEKYKGRN